MININCDISLRCLSCFIFHFCNSNLTACLSKVVCSIRNFWDCKKGKHICLQLCSNLYGIRQVSLKYKNSFGLIFNLFFEQIFDMFSPHGFCSRVSGQLTGLAFFAALMFAQKECHRFPDFDTSEKMFLSLK